MGNTTWGKKHLGRRRRQDGPYFCLMVGSMNESVGHVMYECLELSELRNEAHGKYRFDEIWLVNIMRDERFASVKNLGRFLRLAMEHRSRFL